MEKLKISWCIQGNVTEKAIKRHCPHCGKVTEFRDSGARRHNANGKTIYQFAIYKCDWDHTWNLKLSSYKAHTELAVVDHKEESSLLIASWTN